jgi:hypothetical protein
MLQTGGHSTTKIDLNVPNVPIPGGLGGSGDDLMSQHGCAQL